MNCSEMVGLQHPAVVPHALHDRAQRTSKDHCSGRFGVPFWAEDVLDLCGKLRPLGRSHTTTLAVTAPATCSIA